MARLTKRFVESLGPGAGDQIHWDGALTGFAVRVRPSGKVSFIVQYRTREGRQRRRVIGRYPAMTVEQARRAAGTWLVTAQQGGDPAEGIDLRRQAPTMGDLCDRYLEEHAALHKKTSSLSEDRRIVDTRIKPALGRRKAAAITQWDVQGLHRAMKDTPYMANRVLALLSTVFNRAEGELSLVKAGWRNPCRGVERFKEEKRRRYLAPAELARLGQALALAEAQNLSDPAEAMTIRLVVSDEDDARLQIHDLAWDAVELKKGRLALPAEATTTGHLKLPAESVKVLQTIGDESHLTGGPCIVACRHGEDRLAAVKGPWLRIAEPEAIAAIRLLIFTGCRRSEILALEWANVDYENRQLHLPDSKSGAKDVQLPSPAIEILQALKRKPKNPYVITGRRQGSHLTDIKGPWTRIRDLAGLTDLRLHDLRHSFASVGAGAGLSLPIIGALLGHSQPATTARYAHLARNPLQEAADLVGQRLADAMKGDRGDGGEVVEIRTGRKPRGNV